MRKIIISGGPHTGKSTLLKALKDKFPEAYFVSEPAESLLTRELIKQARNQDYTPVAPWINYAKFGPAVTQESIALESKIPSNSKIVFQDRSLIDTIGYCRLNHFDKFIIEVQKLITKANYNLAFFCDPVGEYESNDIRRESFDEAKKTHEVLLKAYMESGISLIRLPPVSVRRRVQIVQKNLLH
jgi:predicted ATPase